MIRTMTNKIKGITFYSSSFDTDTGTLVREVELKSPPPMKKDPYAYFPRERDFLDELMGSVDSADKDKSVEFNNAWVKCFGHYRVESFSPSPETIDIQITNKCGFGCPNCYQNSTPNKKHGPADLCEKVIKAFDTAPYQVALGGGEPTGHPDFPSILKSIRDLNVVPNYTTAGHLFKNNVIDATNKYCGGIAISYHPHKGIEWFKSTYKKWREALNVQINIHIIADKDVVNSINDVVAMHNKPEFGKINIVLLAFYADVGRSNLTGLMRHNTYMVELPNAIRAARAAGVDIAFSEGMLPYFLSRPDMGVDTRFAMSSEGKFSAYIDVNGWMSDSSFKPPTIYKNPVPTYTATLEFGNLQEHWTKSKFYSSACNESCETCQVSNRCATPDIHHYLICAFAKNNKKSLPQIGVKP